jgi:hypothetical protein
MVCLGNTCEDTLHKGENDDDGNNNNNNNSQRNYFRKYEEKVQIVYRGKLHICTANCSNKRAATLNTP